MYVYNKVEGGIQVVLFIDCC